jgi:hypothetical protein
VSRDCDQCPRLRAEVMRLGRHNEFLRRLVAHLLGGVRSTITYLQAEQEQPTMPRRDLPPAVHARLTYIAEHAEGQRI